MSEPETLPRADARAGLDGTDDVLVQVDNLVKYFPVRGGGLISRTVGHVQAVDGVSLTIGRGQTLGLVGETGCGKSTLARCIAGLIPVTSGTVTFEGHNITNLSRRRDAALPPRDPDDLPGPVRVAEPAPPGRLDHRRPVRGAQDGQRRRAQEGRAGADGAGRAEPRALQPLPGRVLRRPAAAHRRGPGAGAAAQADHLRRARLRPGRVDPGPGAQPAGRPAARLRAVLPVHRPRPGGRPARQQLGHRHVPGPGRRGRAQGPGLRRAAPPVHQRPAVRGARRRPGRRRGPAAHHPVRRRAVADQPAVRLPVPPALPEGPGPVRPGDPAAGGQGGRPGRRT